MNARICPSIFCKTCQIGGKAIDMKCVMCCVRYMKSLPPEFTDDEHIEEYLEYFHRIGNQHKMPEHGENVRAAWEKLKGEK